MVYGDERSDENPEIGGWVLIRISLQNLTLFAYEQIVLSLFACSTTSDLFDRSLFWYYGSRRGLSASAIILSYANRSGEMKW